ncbi:MAG: glycosyltransferase family 4 protein [Candidatus Pacebacteria bacterium]|nr:glycosyltransferase family 4 protein [Candidatus Paceibacterota bacterium]
MRVLVTGYTYTRENLFEVFNSYPEKDKLAFILPSNWTAKNGTVKFKPFKKEGFEIYHSPAFFHHSNFPIIGGLFKGWMPFFVFRLLYLKFTKGIDVMFSTGEPNLLSTTYNALWSKLLGIKFVFNYWENIPYENKDKGSKLFIKKAIISMNVWLSDGAICGMHKAEDILRTFGGNLKIGTFLHAGFNPEKFKPGLDHKEFSQKYGLENKKVFLFVGALGYRKGIHLVLDIISKLKSAYPIKFLIVGSGEYKKELDKKVQELSLESDVVFIPWIENDRLPIIYNSADIFLYPSIPYQGWEEQFGYSIAEASLCGLPVISTNTGSIYEVLLDGKTGLMVAPDSIEQLRSAIVELVDNPEKSIMLGRSGREFVEKNFSNGVISKKMFRLFSEVNES